MDYVVGAGLLQLKYQLDGLAAEKYVRDEITEEGSVQRCKHIELILITVVLLTCRFYPSS